MLTFKIKTKPITKEIDIFCDYVGLNNNPKQWLLDWLQIEKSTYISAKKEEKISLIKHKVKIIYNKSKQNFKHCKELISKFIVENAKQIFDEFAKVFEFDFANKTYFFTIYLGACPICPRFLEEKSFDVCVFDADKHIIQTILHELTHFFWFEKISTMGFDLAKDEKEYPSLTWLVSEIVVDSILKNSGLNKFLANNKPAYEIFYQTNISGENLIEHFNKTFKQNNIENFIKHTFEYISQNKIELENLANKC